MFERDLFGGITTIAIPQFQETQSITGYYTNGTPEAAAALKNAKQCVQLHPTDAEFFGCSPVPVPTLADLCYEVVANNSELPDLKLPQWDLI